MLGSTCLRGAASDAVEAYPVIAKFRGSDIKPRRIAACYRRELARQDSRQHDASAGPQERGEAGCELLQGLGQDVRQQDDGIACAGGAVSYTHLRAHETPEH